MWLSTLLNELRRILWQPLSFKGIYSGSGYNFLGLFHIAQNEAEEHESAFSLGKKCFKKPPFLSWRWRVTHVDGSPRGGAFSELEGKTTSYSDFSVSL